ncbi:MAG: alpha-glucan family phosphorylase [Anaerolineaceae bacterium]|nr:alpha-glucan family phosphorylase [Anaerolineaceae bacterium]
MMDYFNVGIPQSFNLPKKIERLGELAYNLWWSWNQDACQLFAKLNPELWDEVRHNPVEFLHRIERPQLNAAMDNKEYMEMYDTQMAAYDDYMNAENTWFVQEHSDVKDKKIAYFSFEFGLHESLPVYAGGLGILAGDHLKEASDLGLPIAGIGFIYRQGYFTQHITEDGWQETGHYIFNFNEMPVVPLFDEQGEPLKITVPLPGRDVIARIWMVRVGRVPLFMLDTDVPQNSLNDRQLNARLYSADPEVRISQEMVLGIGGVRALRRLGYEADVYHMNEGHSGFLAVERIRELVKEGKTFDEAKELIRKGTIFTTHTPVPAGIDMFPVWLVERFFYNIWPELGIDRDAFIDLAKQTVEYGDFFSMANLAFRLSAQANGVSELHGHVSREMFNFLWPDRKVDDVPISHVTNGVHSPTWLSDAMDKLYRDYLGSDWLDHHDDVEMWAKVDDIPDEVLWQLRLDQKHLLLDFLTKRSRKQWLTEVVHPVQIIAGGVMLDPHALTIGFARRFSTYKRGYLVLRDFDRLLSIINNANRPVQIVFSGKAHPADEPGKLIIQQIYRAVKDAKTGGRLVFVEDYDMNVARYLLQSVDVWMNTPRRPNEASGTSGMKAAINGALNFSVLDGWWHEAYNGTNGWAIGDLTDFDDSNKQDDYDAASLYDVLENEIVPLYYNHFSVSNIPHDWIARMKNSLRTLSPQFSMRRMLKEYNESLYMNAMK